MQGETKMQRWCTSMPGLSKNETSAARGMVHCHVILMSCPYKLGCLQVSQQIKYRSDHFPSRQATAVLPFFSGS